MRLLLQVNADGDGWRTLSARDTANIDQVIEETKQELYKLEQRWRSTYDAFRHAGFRVVEQK